MEVTSKENFIRIKITYDNSQDSNDRDNVFKYLDELYGATGYTIKRQGPDGGCNNLGLIVAEIINKGG